MTKTKEIKSQVDDTNVETVEEEPSPWLYFYSVGCGFCKKAEPIIDELIKEGHDILKLDLAAKENQEIKKQIETEYNKSCGTPWFVNSITGNQICGFREKNLIEKWLDGEDIPAPPRPNGPPPRPPLHGVPKKEEKAWKKEYEKWLKDNEHVPNLQTAEQILERPRPKTEPPKPPMPNSTDEQLDEWGKGYAKWVEENDHLPNLQPVETILQRLKQQRDAGGPVQNNAVQSTINQQLEQRVNSLERKIDKLLGHLGVK